MKLLFVLLCSLVLTSGAAHADYQLSGNGKKVVCTVKPNDPNFNRTEIDKISINANRTKISITASGDEAPEVYLVKKTESDGDTYVGYQSARFENQSFELALSDRGDMLTIGKMSLGLDCK